MKITREFIFAIAPTAKPEYVTAIVSHQSLLSEYGISSVPDVCHFLAQCAAETQSFNKLVESLYYTTTSRLRAVWPSRFKSDAAASPFVRNEQKLANLVYGGRLGNTLPNDGWLYRGSGCPHLTGKSNYQGMQERTGVPCVGAPDLVRAFPAALEAACDFWQANRLHRYTGDVTALTKAWQGGNGALADRKAYTARALKAASALNPTTAPISPAPAQPIPAAQLLRHGSKGEAVRSLQAKLTSRGYDVGRNDGDFGDSTERGVRDFQRDHGLISDGVAGPATMRALNSSTAQAKVPPSAEQPSGLNKFLAWLFSLITRA